MSSPRRRGSSGETLYGVVRVPRPKLAFYMPELPEVETIRRQMQKALVGRKIVSVKVNFAGRLNVSATEFMRRTSGAKIITAGRRAKLLLLGLSNGETVVAHLKMTGKFLLVPVATVPTKHDHVIFALSGGKKLFFRDVRKFGYLKLIKTAQLETEIFDKEGYGPEPLDPSFTAKKFAMCLRGSGAGRIKPRIMAQTCIAGVGNIYADESLWLSRIRPDRRVASLKDAEISALFRAIQGSLKLSVRLGGTSSDDYLDLHGKKGKNGMKLKVYGRGGKPCPRCRIPIKKVRFAGRGTHFCTKCQK